MTRDFAAALAACCAMVAIAVAQQPAPARPTFRTEANYIRVDAFVTREGVPVEDLRAEDFELLEDGKPQKIDAFEHVRIAPAGPDPSRIEPSSQQIANQMAADPRARVFVVFLDIDHVPLEGSHRLKSALATMLSRMLGPDDFVGVVTSRHSPSDLILARKTALIEEQLEKYWYWGRRDTVDLQPDEQMYLNCFQGYRGGEVLAYELIDRRREKLALDALKDLVIHLRGLRDERKAVLAITTGWRLYRPNQALERPLEDPAGRTQVPSGPPVVVGPGGKLMSGDDPRLLTAMSKCERDRMELANIDDWQVFRDLAQDANRANVTFYPIDPRGLVVFDTPIGPRKPPSLQMDGAILRERQTSLRTIADQTDGIAVVNMGDLTEGLRRVSADLSSYYLIGYYSSNSALDGRYRTITVRTKRPGLQVRARRGYRAATREEVARGAAAAAGSSPASTAAETAVRSALNRLALIRPDAALYIHATHVPGGALWVSGEIPLGVARAAGWANGGRASIVAVDQSGATIGVARHTLMAGERDFIVAVPLDDPSRSPARIQVRVEGEGGEPAGLEVAPQSGEPLLLRQSGAAKARAAADFRFHRTEILLYRWALVAEDRPQAARVLDRSGNPMALTATAAEVTTDGARWMSGSVTLAPLTNGDYLLELTKNSRKGVEKSVVPFRIVR